MPVRAPSIVSYFGTFRIFVKKSKIEKSFLSSNFLAFHYPLFLFSASDLLHAHWVHSWPYIHSQPAGPVDQIRILIFKNTFEFCIFKFSNFDLLPPLISDQLDELHKHPH